MNRLRLDARWEWPLLAAATTLAAVLLYIQAQGTKRRYEMNQLEVISIQKEFTESSARYDHNFDLVTKLIALAQTNAAAASIIQRHGIAISSAPRMTPRAPPTP